MRGLFYVISTFCCGIPHLTVLRFIALTGNWWQVLLLPSDIPVMLLRFFHAYANALVPIQYRLGLYVLYLLIVI